MRPTLPNALKMTHRYQLALLALSDALSSVASALAVAFEWLVNLWVRSQDAGAKIAAMQNFRCQLF